MFVNVAVKTPSVKIYSKRNFLARGKLRRQIFNHTSQQTNITRQNYKCRPANMGSA